MGLFLVTVNYVSVGLFSYRGLNDDQKVFPVDQSSINYYAICLSILCNLASVISLILIGFALRKNNGGCIEGKHLKVNYPVFQFMCADFIHLFTYMIIKINYRVQ